MRQSTHAEDRAHRKSLEERKHMAIFNERQRAKRIEDALRSLLSHFAPVCDEYLDGNNDHVETYNACQEAREALQAE